MRSLNHYRRGQFSFAGKKTPWIVLGVCAAAAILLTIITGNLLKLWLNDETYQKLTGGGETGTTDTVYQAPTKNVHAYALALGEAPAYPDVSLTLNTHEGHVTYASEIAEYFGIAQDGKTALREGIEKTAAYGGDTYISGVFRPQAFDADGQEMLYAQASVDCALIYEFLQAGGSEILLCDIPFSDVPLDSVIRYLKIVKGTVGTAPVGVSVPLAVAQRADAWEIMGTLLSVCDFLALDIRSASVALSDCSFYLVHYDMRLLMGKSQTHYISAARDTGVEDLQTIDD